MMDQKIDKKNLKSIKPKLDGKSDNILLNTNFTLKNFKKVLFENEFIDLLLTTFYYTFFGNGWLNIIWYFNRSNG